MGLIKKGRDALFLIILQKMTIHEKRFKEIQKKFKKSSK